MNILTTPYASLKIYYNPPNYFPIDFKEELSTMLEKGDIGENSLRLHILGCLIMQT